jgi:hypothetical protein
MEEEKKECHFCRTIREMSNDPSKIISYVELEEEYWDVFYRVEQLNKHTYVAVSLPSAVIDDQIRESGNHATLKVHISRIAWINLICTVTEKLKRKLGALSVTLCIPDPTGKTSEHAKDHFRVPLDVKLPKQPRS